VIGISEEGEITGSCCGAGLFVETSCSVRRITQKRAAAYKADRQTHSCHAHNAILVFITGGFAANLSFSKASASGV